MLSILKRETVKPYVLVLPIIIYLFLFVLFPTFYTWYMSLCEYDWRGVTFSGLTNYLELVKDDIFWKSLLNSLYLGGGAVGIEFLLGFFIALVLNRNFFGRSFVLWVILLPMIIPPVAVGLTFRILYDPSLGLINYLIQILGGRGQEWLTNGQMAMLAIIFIDVWEWTPFVTLILLSGLQYIPYEVKEASKIDGASSIQFFRYITLPIMKSIIALALIFRLIDIFNKTFDIIFMTTRGGPGYVTQTLPIYAFYTGFTYLKFGYAATQGIITFFVIVILVSLVRRVIGEKII